MAKIKKIILCSILISFISFLIFLAVSVPFISIFSMPNTLFGDVKSIDYINQNAVFGSCIKAVEDKKIYASNNNYNQCKKIDLKLFNLLTIKSFYLNDKDIEVYVGGDVVGFSLNNDGVVIIGVGAVDTDNGKVNTTQKSDIKKGDIIKKIEGQNVFSVADICRITNKDENKNRELDIIIKRKDKEINTTIENVLDKNSGIYKLGLWVKDDISGIGTLTYIRKDNSRFGALGHSICDADTKTVYNINGGEMYPCTVIGIKKGSKGKPGELKGLFMQGKNNKRGSVDKNCDYGVFGEVCDEKLQYNKECMLAGGRLYAKPGKAYIRSSIDGNASKDYEIEIVKTNYQSSSNEKSMVIKIVDKELIEKTGGIIQGMSGSPIIQNGRVIGAVTHVFINDPTKGFGVYLDWMVDL